MIKNQTDYFDIDDVKSNLKKHAIRSGAVTVIARAANFLIHTGTTMILARILVPEDFGLFVMATALVGFLTIFMDLGLTDAVIQDGSISHQQISNLFWINVGIALIIVVLTCAAAPLIAWFYSEPRLLKITIVWSLYLFVGALSTQHIALLKRQMLFFDISIIEIAAMLIGSVIAVIMAFYGWDYWSLVFRQIFIGAFTALGAWVICKWRPRLPSRKADVGSLLRFGRNATGSYIVGYFSVNLDKILIGIYYGARQLGFYHKAYYLFVLPATQLSDALRNVATSTLSKIRNNPSQFINYYLKAVSLISFIGMPVSFFMMAEGRDVVLLMLGPQWEPSVRIFQVLAAGTGIWMIYSTRYWLHASLGRSDRLIRWSILDSIVVALAVVAGLRFGPIGIAVSYTIALYILAALGIRYAGQPIGLKLREVFSAVWINFTAALLAGLIIWQFSDYVAFDWNRLTRLSVVFPFYCFSYLLLTIIFNRSIEHIKSVLGLVKEIIPGRAAAL